MSRPEFFPTNKDAQEIISTLEALESTDTPVLNAVTIDPLPGKWDGFGHYVVTTEPDPDYKRKFICAYIRANLPIEFSDGFGDIQTIEAILDGTATSGYWVRKED